MPLLIPSSRTICSPCHRSANHPAHLRSNPLLRGLRRPCPSIASQRHSIPCRTVATHPISFQFPCRAFRRLSQPLHSVSALRAAIRRPGPLRFAQAVRCFALSLPRLAELCPSLALLGPAHPLPRSALQIVAFPWRVSASLIHGHAPLAELILRSVFPCYSFAMQCLSVPSRLVS